MIIRKVQYEIEGQLTVKNVAFITEFKDDQTGEVITVKELTEQHGLEGYEFARQKTNPDGTVSYQFFTNQWMKEHSPIEVREGLSAV